eukprot:12914528-Prorocentrum_lima.AAC.1
MWRETLVDQVAPNPLPPPTLMKVSSHRFLCNCSRYAMSPSTNCCFVVWTGKVALAHTLARC